MINLSVSEWKQLFSLHLETLGVTTIGRLVKQSSSILAKKLVQLSWRNFQTNYINMIIQQYTTIFGNQSHSKNPKLALIIYVNTIQIFSNIFRIL